MSALRLPVTQTTYQPTEIFHEISIRAPSSAIYAAVTEPDRIAAWWLPAKLGQRNGFRTLRFGPGEGFQEVLLTEQLPGKIIRWKATDFGLADWIDTEIEFRLLRKGAESVLQLRHSKWKADASLFPHSSLSWAVFLVSLRDYVETGTGSPYPNGIIGR